MSQRDAKVFTIGEHRYEVYMLPPKVARHMLVDVGKVLAPAVGALAGKGGLESVLDSSVDVGAALGGMMDRLDHETLDRHFDALAKVTHVDGKPLGPIFEVHFMGAVGEQMEWFAFAMRANFEDFFGVLQRASAPLRAVAAGKASPSQTT